jgi:hypothetical protein
LADLTFDLKGAADVRGKIAAALLTMRTQAADALYREAEVEMIESKKRCPRDTGTLYNSGHVQPPEDTKDGISVTMGYGGAAEDYAIVQHENLEFHHKVGQAKFLESVLQESAPYLLERIAKRIKL